MWWPKFCLPNFSPQNSIIDTLSCSLSHPYIRLHIYLHMQVHCFKWMSQFNRLKQEMIFLTQFFLKISMFELITVLYFTIFELQIYPRKSDFYNIISKRQISLFRLEMCLRRWMVPTFCFSRALSTEELVYFWVHFLIVWSRKGNLRWESVPKQKERVKCNSSWVIFILYFIRV